MVDLRVKEWTSKFQKLQGGKEIVSLTGETSADLRLLEKGDVIICTPAQVYLNIYLLTLITECCSLVGRGFATMASTEECANSWATYC